MTVPTLVSRLWTEPVTKCLTACFCLIAASGLVLSHLRSIHEVGEIGLPAAKRVTALEQRLEVLRQQMEATRAQAALKGDAQEEVIRQTVLPATAELAHVLSLFDLLRDNLSKDGLVLSMSEVTVGEPVAAPNQAGVDASAVNVRFGVTRSGVDAVLLFFELTGFLTVGDALSPSEREQLLVLTERENAAGLPALEEFLRTPLLTYARGSQAARDELAKNFGSDQYVSTLERIIQNSRLPQVRFLLGGTFGVALQDAGLWPLRFMTVDRTEISQRDDGTFELSLQLSAYSRSAAQ